MTDSILDSWATGPRDPGFTTLLLGQRGAGKTALMGVLAEEAKKSRWVVITANAYTNGLLNRIEEELDATEHMLQGGPDPDAKGRITGVQVMGSGGSMGAAPAVAAADSPSAGRLGRPRRRT